MLVHEKEEQNKALSVELADVKRKCKVQCYRLLVFEKLGNRCALVVWDTRGRIVIRKWSA
jgi:hypothetical protein